jgi:diaminohydroxyphosphoribosylaminopyrimidine deaminase/5-amino-6-(5-phosphoribosylamino)uracil reductase
MSDAQFMRLAFRLARARRGYGMTSPNPMVGAVLVKGGKVIGRAGQADDLQPFDAKQFAQALFEE